MSAPPEQLQQTFVELEAQSDWRFELESDENIAVRVSRAGCFCSSVVVLSCHCCVLVANRRQMYTGAHSH